MRVPRTPRLLHATGTPVRSCKTCRRPIAQDAADTSKLWIKTQLEPRKGTAMAGLKDKRGFIDKERLDLSERKAVEYWMKRWGVTRDQITAAHRKVGRLTKDIAAELGKKR
jgi:hypothetical protein